MIGFSATRERWEYVALHQVQLPSRIDAYGRDRAQNVHWLTVAWLPSNLGPVVAWFGRARCS